MKMSNSVNLVFNKTITKLAGFPYGENVFENQVKDKIDLRQPCEIIFPSNIEKVASSFVQGFFSEIVKSIGLQGVEDNINLKTSSKELTENIWNKLFL